MARFDIQVSDEAVSVKTTGGKGGLGSASIFTIAFCLGCATYLLKEVIPLLAVLLHDRSNGWGWLSVLPAFFLSGALAWAAIRILFPSGETLECDRQTLRIGRIPTRVLTGRWEYQSFAVDSVTQLHFGVVSLSKYGSLTGFLFQADGKLWKTLSGLESPEADRILPALEKIGVKIIHDPAMPMMVEMTLSRRKSWFRWIN